ncbi:MAG: helix-turn-helix domain-containing protein [Clostridia bacterium]|nr:helix-turn-helix domain-containing protein [Clostridia bacterium]MBQ6177799.1 helix-turn-helix domain-containing protein [Bacteroidales bacterium]
MEMHLAENIRRLRKERGLTQEQLSEVLGVTAGAVYKWEAKLSVPDLDLIAEMAEFFDVSVDVLLGYEMKDNRPETVLKRLRGYRRGKDPAGLEEAEKAIRKYPHSFALILESALMYLGFGLESADADRLRRSLELLERSLPLLSQNTDPKVSEQTLYGEMAVACLGLGEWDRGIELMKAHNAGGMYNFRIGNALSQGGHTEEAELFLSEALTGSLSDLMTVLFGYINVFFQRRDYTSARAIASWGIGVMTGLRKDGRPNYLDKYCSVLTALLAAAQFMSGDAAGARASLVSARRQAAFFDASPSYAENDVRFIRRVDGVGAYDDIGATAMDAVRGIVRDVEDGGAFAALWASVEEEEESHE